MDKLFWKKPPAKLSIPRSELHIWRIDLVNFNTLTHDLSSILSCAELKRSKRFIFDSDRHRYQVTHIMKRLILCNYLDCDPRCLYFEVGYHGKPALDSLKNRMKIQFNIAYSRDLILIAIASKDSIGVDVEYNDKKPLIDSLCETVFSLLEKRFFVTLISQQEKKEAFLRCWTRKEAYLKNLGIGLIDNLASISVGLNKTVNSHDWLKVSTFSPSENLLKLFPLDIDNYYIASVVASSFQKYLLCYKASQLLSV